MLQLLQRLNFRAIKFNWIVVVILLLLWAAILVSTVWSIRSQPYSRRQRNFWLVVVICIPLFGVLAYLPFSFKKEDLPFIFQSRKKPKKRRRNEAAISDERDV